MGRKKVLLVELNEITWDLIDPLIEQGQLPTFARIKREGAWAAPMSVDLPPQLDPWITWTTVYTGRPQADHNVFFLQQPPETITARRIWDICHDRGLSVGVYGSLCSWPPRPVKGFYVPDTFSPDPSTYPEDLRAIQELNLTYTRSVRLPSERDNLRFKARLGARLVALGLGASAIARVTGQLAREKMNPDVRWQRAALQPLVNYDFFSRLYRKHRPHFATFHSNHVAHYMHSYWKAMQPEVFPQQTSPEEVRAFGNAIEYGYTTADDLLRRMMRLLDGDTVMVLASSMGQKPFITGLKNGKAIVQLRSLDKILDILGVRDSARALSTMSDQFNIYTDSPRAREAVMSALDSAYIDTPDQRMFETEAIENSVTVTLRRYDAVSEDSRCCFPRPGGGESFRYEDLVYSTGLVKSGCHDPRGTLAIYGPGIKRGERIGECNNLDIAPTVLTLLGLDVPPEMGGRVLSGAFAERL